MREYEKTHPWLKFNIDLRQLPYNIWVKLGECQSKCEHISGVPLRQDTANRLYNIYLAKGALASAAIEGNTLTEEEARRRIEGQLKLPPSREYLGQELDNIVFVCNETLQAVREGQPLSLNGVGIKELNRVVLNKLQLDEHIIPGEIRTYKVGVGRYEGAPPEDCAYLLERLCEWLTGDAFKPPTKELEIVFAVIKAIAAHLYFSWIHPFGDGNGRTARLTEFQILISSGVPSPAAHLLSSHYNLTRAEYYRQLDYSSKSGGEIIPFLSYAVQGFLDGLKEQLKFVQKQLYHLTWESILSETFGARDKPGDVRRRLLANGIYIKNQWLKVSELTEIGPQIAKMYATKTKKTLTRDLTQLQELDLIVKQGSQVRAKTEIIRMLLAERVTVT